MKIYEENETTNDSKEVKIITPVDIISSINNSRGLTLTIETILNYKHDIYSKVSEHIVLALSLTPVKMSECRDQTYTNF